MFSVTTWIAILNVTGHAGCCQE